MQSTLPLPGQVVWIRQRRWRVERALRDRHVVRLDVASRDRRLTFLSPFDRPLAPAAPVRQRCVRRQQALARAAHLIARAPDVRLPLAIVDAQADILPHQLEPALAMIGGWPRLLLADEVGLGKTVQAGLIIAELIRREPAPRALVLVPASLRDQWVAELRHRFAVDCVVADRPGLDQLTRAGAFGDNPWRRAGVWLTSPDFLKQRHVVESLPPDPWDLVVIDEAHTACGDSDRYAACQAVASRARRVVLLTATPHSGDATRFARLTDLGLTTGGRNDLVIFRRTRSELGVPASRRVRWHRIALAEPEEQALAALVAFEQAVLSSGGRERADEALLLLSVFRKRALSSFSALSRSVARRLAWLGEELPEDGLDWAQPRLAFGDECDDGEAEERAAVMGQTGVDPRRERAWLRRLRQLADEAARKDSKIARVVTLIARTSEPVAVFTEFRDSLAAVERRLRRSRSVSILHGLQDLAERRLQLRRFLDGSASVLLATDVAGQGLNLQSRARWVISLELPWNPARLEQRIGRVDRLGQTRSTHLTLIVARHETENGLLAHLARRVLDARRAFAASALESVAPPESEVRAALLGPLDPVTTTRRDDACEIAATIPPAAVSRRWRRASVVVAHGLARRRALARQWRAPAEDAVAIGRARTPRLSHFAPSGGDAVLLGTVPILNGHGELVERLVFALSIPAALASVCHSDLFRNAIAAALERRITRRVARTSRALAAAASRMIQRERAIGDLLRAEGLPSAAQPGLFDRRDLREFEALLATGTRLEQAAVTRIDALEAAGRLSTATPSIDIVLMGRP